MKNDLVKLSFCKHTLKIRQDPTSDTSELVFVTLQYNLSQHQYHFANYLSLHSKFNSYHYLQKFYHVQCKHKNLYNWAYECSDVYIKRKVMKLWPHWSTFPNWHSCTSWCKGCTLLSTLFVLFWLSSIHNVVLSLLLMSLYVCWWLWPTGPLWRIRDHRQMYTQTYRLTSSQLKSCSSLCHGIKFNW